MKKYSILFFTLFFCSFCFSQQKTTNNNLLPVSIYTASFKIKVDETPSYSSINRNLNFKNRYRFTTVSFEDIDSNQFLITDTNLSIKPTSFIYDDYKSYRDENLLKGFLQKHDLTRWNICNFRQPNLN